MFGPAEAAAALRNALAPFADLGVAGAMPSQQPHHGRHRQHVVQQGGTRRASGLQQDPIEYNSATWHTNLDTYERIVPEDVMNASTVIAAAVWHVANRDQMVPRFAKESMPAPAARRGPGNGGERRGHVRKTDPTGHAMWDRHSACPWSFYIFRRFVLIRLPQR